MYRLSNECLCPPAKKAEIYVPEAFLKVKSNGISVSSAGQASIKPNIPSPPSVSGSKVNLNEPKPKNLDSLTSNVASKTETVSAGSIATTSGSVSTAERPESVVSTERLTRRVTIRSRTGRVTERPGTGLLAIKKAVTVTTRTIILLAHIIAVTIRYPSNRLAEYCRKRGQEGGAMFNTMASAFQGITGVIDCVYGLIKALQNCVDQRLNEAIPSD